MIICHFALQYYTTTAEVKWIVHFCLENSNIVYLPALPDKINIPQLYPLLPPNAQPIRELRNKELDELFQTARPQNSNPDNEHQLPRILKKDKSLDGKSNVPTTSATDKTIKRPETLNLKEKKIKEEIKSDGKSEKEKMHSKSEKKEKMTSSNSNQQEEKIIKKNYILRSNRIKNCSKNIRAAPHWKRLPCSKRRKTKKNIRNPVIKCCRRHRRNTIKKKWRNRLNRRSHSPPHRHRMSTKFRRHQNWWNDRYRIRKRRKYLENPKTIRIMSRIAMWARRGRLTEVAIAMVAATMTIATVDVESIRNWWKNGETFWRVWAKNQLVCPCTIEWNGDRRLVIRIHGSKENRMGKKENRAPVAVVKRLLRQHRQWINFYYWKRRERNIIKN